MTQKLTPTALRRQVEDNLAAERERLVQDLQIHQLELEAQNEELRQARAEAEAALAQYTALYDFAPVGYFTLTRDSVIQQVNLTGAQMLGLPRAQLLHQRFGALVTQETKLTFNAF